MTFRIERIQQYLKQQTQLSLKEKNIDDCGIDALEISQVLKLDRSNTSRELNKLWKEGKAVKIQGRPILFLDYTTLKNEYPFQYIPLTVSNDHSISYYLNSLPERKQTEDKVNPLSRIIGATNGSMKKTVDSAVAAISYKPLSLPILLRGNKGVRKRRFVQAIFDYCVEKSIKKSNSKLLIVNCAEFSDNEENFINLFFGVGNSKGALESTNGGLIYLQNIHTLTSNSISLISDLISFGYFFRQQDNAKRMMNASIIATINDECSESMEQYLSSLFPLAITIPPFNDRNIYEKIELILNIFTEEAQAINHNIIISRSILSMFVLNKYKENERQIRNMIRFTCASSMLRSNLNETNVIEIAIDDLPYDLLANNFSDSELSSFTSSINLYDENTIVCEANGNCDCFDFFSKITTNFIDKNLKDFINEFTLNEKNINNLDSFIVECFQTTTKCDDIHYNEIRRNVKPEVRMAFLKSLYNDPYYELLMNSPRSIYGAMLAISNSLDNNLNDDEFVEYDSHNKELSDSQKICDYLKIKNLVIQNFITTYLIKVKQLIRDTKVSMIIVSRGKSIASEMKEELSSKANLYNVPIEAVNYPSAMQLNDILELVIIALKKTSSEAGSVVFVDGYPLNEAEVFLKSQSETNCRLYSSVAFDVLFNALECCNKSYSLEQFTSQFKPSIVTNVSNQKEEDFIAKLISNAFNKTVTHINPTRAVDPLIESLDLILNELKINKTQEITVKFLSHGIHMLERIIKNNPLEYYHLKQFTSKNHNLMDIIAESLIGVENTFDLHVPSSEIAYLAEIFLEGI